MVVFFDSKKTLLKFNEAFYLDGIVNAKIEYIVNEEKIEKTRIQKTKGAMHKMKIKQSYHGTGSKEGYLYQLYRTEKTIEEIELLPCEVNIGSILEIENEHYRVTKVYDCEISPEEDEVIWFELEPYAFQADFVLKMKR